MNDMTNSHILVHEFIYLEPGSVAEAIDLLAAHGDAARVLAGGTDLLVQMKMERQKPAYVIGIGKLAELNGIRRGVEKLTIGALTTIRELARDAGMRNRYTALAEACAAFSTAQVQAMGTVGGNLCNGSPASDTAPALIALGAEVVLVGPEGETRLPLERFFRGPGKTARRPDQLLTAVEVPLPAAQAGSAFVKVGRVAADIAKANAAVYLLRDGDRIVDCRLAFGSVAPTPMRAPRAEAILRGQVLTPEVISQAAAVAAEEISPIDDVRSTAAYRRQVVAALTADGINRAWERAETRGRGDAGTRGRGDAETRGRGDTGTRGRGDYETYHVSRNPTGTLRNTQYAIRNTHHAITLTVNGVSRCLHVADNDLLLNVLREDLELTGTKYGCGIGECSACTVLMDGKPVLACLVLAAAADGSHIRTVEGLAAPDGTLDPLQEAFIEHAALQCGFCTPGMLMTAKDLLEANPHPSEVDVRDHLRGNMCRCTGYAAIVRAVLAAAETMTNDQ
jgi:xanthine dehydrogenase iron-sulfur cluster and FAD-binding subunit A